MKDVIIVSTNKLRPFAVVLKRGLGKFYDITAANWSDEYFKDNEATITNKTMLIFIGSSSIISPYIDDVFGMTKFNHHNCLWGWDGAIAKIKVEGDPENYSEFKEHSKNYAAAEKLYQGRAWELNDNKISNYDLIKFLFLRIFFPPALFFPSSLFFPLHTKEQYKYAIMTFLKFGLPDFQNSVDS
jgi:hypothetical protein